MTKKKTKKTATSDKKKASKSDKQAAKDINTKKASTASVKRQEKDAKRQENKKKKSVVKAQAKEKINEAVAAAAAGVAASPKSQKIVGIVLLIMAAAALFWAFSILVYKLFQPQALADILPAEGTVGLVEINVDGQDQQIETFFDLFQRHAVYQPAPLTRMMNEYVGDAEFFEERMQPWLGRRIGLALVSLDEDAFTPLIFMEYKNREDVMKYFIQQDHLTVEDTSSMLNIDYNGSTLYKQIPTLPGARGVFIQNYLVVSPSETGIKAYIDHLADQPRLAGDADYNKVANNLSRDGLVFGYVNYDQLFAALNKDAQFMAQEGQDIIAFKPFLELFQAEGIHIHAEDNRLVAQTFTSIDTEKLGDEGYITFQTRYRGELLRLLGPSPVMVLGGHDLTKEIHRLEEIFTSSTKTPAMVFEGFLEGQKQQYLGKDVDLEEEVYPLLTGEYALAVDQSLAKPLLSMLIALEDGEESVQKFERLMQKFVDVSGIFSPRIETFELPDGTIGREIVASPEIIQRTTSTYEGQNIVNLEIGDTGIMLHYTYLGNVFALANDEDILKEIIDRRSNRLSNNMTTTQQYRQNVEPLLRHADQLVYTEVGTFVEIFGLNEQEELVPYLIPFNGLTSAKNFFRDGMSTIYFLEVI